MSSLALVNSMSNSKDGSLVNQSSAAQFRSEPMSKYLLESSLMVIVSLILRLVFRTHINNYATCLENSLIPGPYEIYTAA